MLSSKGARRRQVCQSIAQAANAVVFDRLEGRTLFTAAFPTVAEQYALQPINRARANPTAEVQLLAADPSWGGAADLNEGLAAGTISATAKQPVAFDPFITDAAQKHSQWMLTNGSLSHNETDAGFVTPTNRAVTAGFTAPPKFDVGENIAFAGGVADANAASAQLEKGLFIDNYADAQPGTPGARGHRLQMMNDLASLAGVGLATDGNSNFLTENFTNGTGQGYLTGVAINDTNSNNFYDPAKGLAA